MQVFRQELQSFPLRAFIDEVKETLGEAATERLLAKYRVTERELMDPQSWVSLEFVEALLEDLENAVGDPDFVNRATVRGMKPRYIGPLYPLLFAVGSPLFTCRQLPRLAGRINKTGTWICEDSRPGFARLLWKHTPGASRETKTFVCRTREIQLRLMPMMFGIPPASVLQRECLVRGDPACVYEVSWTETQARRHGAWGALAGAVAGAFLAVPLGLAPWPFVYSVAGLAVAGWALGRLWVVRHDLQDRVRDIAEHNQALDRVTQANEARYKELLEAKADVERKVDERTAELRRTSADLERTLAQLREMDRAKTDFFHSVSHELRTPLTLILEPIHYLVRGEEPPGGREAALSAMQGNAEDLRTLVTDLLDLARIDAGAMPLRRSPVEPAALIERVLGRFATAARHRDVKLGAELPEHAVSALWDAGWVERALGNLVANALRHVEPGGHVSVRLSQTGGSTRIEVVDDGEGIDEAEAGRVFERFAQAGKGTRGGSGLGLAIVREAARLHGGNAEVHSRRGEGATFTLQLPPPTVEEAHAAAREAAPSDTPPAFVLPRDLAPLSTEEPSSHPGPHAGAPLALVVEDDPDLRRFMAAVLAERYRVRTAADGQRGLEAALEETPEVVVSDVAMPKLDGLGLCRALRAHEATRTVPVILVTAAADQTRVLEGFEAGASDHVLKPFHARELLARVDVHARLRALTREVGRRERLATLGTVAASVAHQVRNPLTTLASGLPAMRRRIGDRIDAPSLELLDTMLDCARRIEEVTNDLLDLSRVDRAEDDDVQPGVGLLAAVRLARARATSADVKVDVDVDERAVMRGRAGDLNQVFLNLLDNAARAIGDRGTIRVQARVEAGAYVVRVDDSGPGIPQELVQRVFEPFWTSRPAGQGTGLGLAIAKQVVEAHGGTIAVARSTLGGAGFELRLPMRRTTSASMGPGARLSV